jgi:hypothetical protein
MSEYLNLALVGIALVTWLIRLEQKVKFLRIEFDKLTNSHDTKLDKLADKIEILIKEVAEIHGKLNFTRRDGWDE